MIVSLNLFPERGKLSVFKNQTNPNSIGYINNLNLKKDSFERQEVTFTGISTVGEKAIKSIADFSPLEQVRLKYKPKLVPALRDGINNILMEEGIKTNSIAHQDEISKLFPKTYGQPILTFTKGKIHNIMPHKVAVILSGGQASGGHNVITGLYDALKKANSQSEVYGFLGGPSGLIDGKYIKLEDAIVDNYRNMGGFDMIGSGRTKLEKPEQFEKVLENCKKLGINAITIIGGDDSNTNAALLAEWFAKKGEKISVIGCPKTIDGDLKNAQIETPFGFDTATKTFAETVGNIQRDALSAKKYWHFVKIMGRSASHVALEVAHQTHPNITLISEEVAKKGMSLNDVVNYITDTIVKRAAKGKNYGVVVVPEGLLEFVPEMKSLISKLNDIMPDLENDVNFNNAIATKDKFAIVEQRLSRKDAQVYASLPANIKVQLLKERDPHGNVQVSQLDTDKLLIEMVKSKLSQLQNEGLYSGKFSAVSQFSGYDGRSGLPTNFDSNYCYSLGYSAAALINSGKTGYLATVKNLDKNVSNWAAGGTPITMMMNLERRNGEMKPVIKKALVELDGPVFKEFGKVREDWAMNDKYLCPGPIQYTGQSDISNSITKTLQLEQSHKA